VFNKDLLKGRAVFLTGGELDLAVRWPADWGIGARMFLVGRREDPLRETCERFIG